MFVSDSALVLLDEGATFSSLFRVASIALDLLRIRFLPYYILINIVPLTLLCVAGRWNGVAQVVYTDARTSGAESASHFLVVCCRIFLFPLNYPVI
jgi:hypothetical protein